MGARRYDQGRKQAVWFSPYLLAIGLSFALFQTSTPLSCKSGDTTLWEFQVIVQGQDRIVGFDPNQRDYNVSLPLGTDEARVRTVTTDPAALVWVDVLVGSERFRYLNGVVGGSDLVVPLPPGPSVLQVWVRAPKGASDSYHVEIQIGIGTDFCSEQPVECSASGECLTDGVCDPMCDPIDAGNGLCNRCPRMDTPLADGTPCSVGFCDNGSCASCPTLTKVTVVPLQANVGDDIDVSVQAFGTGTIDYLWTATAGSFAGPTAPITTYRCEEAGQQVLTITISDGAGSCTDEYTAKVTCLGVDGDPPVLTDLVISPQSVDVGNGPANVQFTLQLADETGVEWSLVQLNSPTSGQFVACLPMLSSGDDLNGTWTCTATIAQGAEPGAWQIQSVKAHDTLSNFVWYTTADLQMLGFPTQLDVTHDMAGDNLCPKFFVLNAIPSNIQFPNTSTEVQVRAEDDDDGPLPLVTTFHALSGSFDDVHAPDTVYTCGDPGLIEICADASDGACVKTACIDVRCPEAD